MEERVNVGFVYRNTSCHFPLSNVFGLTSPEAYYCRIERYIEGNSYLDLLAAEQRPTPGMLPYAIQFTMVLYHAGPMEWTGANFCVPPPHECVQFVKQHIASFRDAPDSLILDGLVLFTIDSPLAQVRIVASLGDRYVHPDYKRYARGNSA
jgi:hypothetical protein